MDISLNKEMNRIRNRTAYKGCVHQDSDCNGITSYAHSIQNNRYLDKLSSNGEVLCIDFGKLGLNKKLQLHSVGRKKASIFTGFCNYHDSSIFKPIEEYDYEAGNREQEFLYAYRAFALSYYERHSSFQFTKEHLKIKAQNREDIKKLEAKVNLYEGHLKFIENLRISMNKNLDNKKFGRIRTEVLEWPQNYGLAATSMFFVDKDTKGRQVNNPSGYIAPFFFSIIPQLDVTYVLLSYLTKDRDRYKFIRSQIVDADIDEQKMLISNILAMNVENFFISHERWNALPSNTREMFLKVLESTMGREKPRIGHFGQLNVFV